MVKKIIIILIIIFLLYTRFVNLSWGLPYPMHPDERNMANAIQSLNCEISNSKFQVSDCFNPHFFAYGQFPLYLGRFIVFVLKFFDGDLNTSVSFPEAVFSLRIISATASVINVLVLVKIIELLTPLRSKTKDLKKSKFYFVFSILIFTLVPYAIQFSHFVTTESLLMLFYSLIIYLSLKYLVLSSPARFWGSNKRPKQDYHNNNINSNLLILNSFVGGLAIATKISSVVFLAIPVVALLLKIKDHRHLPKTKLDIKIKNLYFLICRFVFLTLIFTILFSPHNIISFKEFLSSVRYETDVALGRYLTFYTRQFWQTTPVVFQIKKVFPYTLGWI